MPITRSPQISKDTEQEIVFQTPLWARLFSLSLLALFGWCLFVLYSGFFTQPHKDQIIGVLLGWMPIGFFLLFFYVSLPHTLSLDFRRRIYEEKIGFFPLEYRYSGDFDDIAGTLCTIAKYVGSMRCHICLKFREESVRKRPYFTRSGHKLITCGNDKDAEEYATHLAERIGVPYLGMRRIN